MNRARKAVAVFVTSTLAFASVACGSDDTEQSATLGSGRLAPAARDELVKKGVNKYSGVASPKSETTNAAGDTVYTFDPSSGAVCYLGAEFKTVVHHTASENLVIFLEGGGACWRDFCQAKNAAGDAILKAGILDQDPSKNVVGDWNIVYVPYCDGSVFSGDNDTMGPDGTPWKFHGLRNLSAAIDVAKDQFPAPKRILLAGSSAGGYGTIIGTAVTRLQYPDTDMVVFNDAGLGLSNPDNPSMIEHIREDWNFSQYTPDSCTECAGAQQTALIAWGLKNDPSLKASAFSAYEDGVIGGIFLQMAGPDFKALLLAESTKVHDAYPARFERYFIAGTQHTGLQASYYTSTVDGVTLADFTRGMIEGTPAWRDLLE